MPWAPVSAAGAYGASVGRVICRPSSVLTVTLPSAFIVTSAYLSAGEPTSDATSSANSNRIGEAYRVHTAGLPHDHLIERRPAILRATDAAIYELNRRPASCFGAAAEFLELILRFLIEGGNASVDRSSHIES